jgi:hypothetical protein
VLLFVPGLAMHAAGAALLAIVIEVHRRRT